MRTPIVALGVAIVLSACGSAEDTGDTASLTTTVTTSTTSTVTTTTGTSTGTTTTGTTTPTGTSSTTSTVTGTTSTSTTGTGTGTTGTGTTGTGTTGTWTGTGTTGTWTGTTGTGTTWTGTGTTTWTTGTTTWTGTTSTWTTTTTGTWTGTTGTWTGTTTGTWTGCTSSDLMPLVETRDATGALVTTFSTRDRVHVAAILRNPCANDITFTTPTTCLVTGMSADNGSYGVGVAFACSPGSVSWTVPAGDDEVVVEDLGTFRAGSWTVDATWDLHSFAATSSFVVR